MVEGVGGSWESVQSEEGVEESGGVEFSEKGESDDKIAGKLGGETKGHDGETEGGEKEE